MNLRTKLALLFFTLFFSNCTQVSENYYTYENDDSFEYKVDQFAAGSKVIKHSNGKFLCLKLCDEGDFLEEKEHD